MVVKYDKTPAHSAALLLPERAARQSEAIWKEAKQIDREIMKRFEILLERSDHI